ncbi:Ribonucleotide reduction protein NrdI [Anoxybacillus flavithermus]|uniref:Ribonucleotide reduction protein NrdI n=1 Tax=Anoxybacillus flavithermus TaxID=33934 RepID=A0A178TAJ4_9BACL|nr:Ribonucleotide reduction protein NrdI [Anoxybacillus flavithermus]
MNNIIIAYDSKTGNVQRFINKVKNELDIETVKIHEDSIIQKPFILVTYTTGFGQVPKTTKGFLMKNHQYMIAVASSGNMNWGMKFAVAADEISKKYSVPIILKFELSGTQKDVQRFIEEVRNIDNTCS